MRQLRLTSSARADVGAAFAWYEVEQAGLGEAFRRSLEAVLSTLIRRPAAYPKITPRFHRAVMRRYPYIVIYDFDEKQVVVHAVFHTSRNPSSLRGRLGDA